MKKFKNTRLHKMMGGKGMYITLGACLLAVGGAGVAAYNRAVTQINDSLDFSLPDASSVVQEQQADMKQEDVEMEDSSSVSEQM